MGCKSQLRWERALLLGRRSCCCRSHHQNYDCCCCQFTYILLYHCIYFCCCCCCCMVGWRVVHLLANDVERHEHLPITEISLFFCAMYENDSGLSGRRPLPLPSSTTSSWVSRSLCAPSDASRSLSISPAAITASPRRCRSFRPSKRE